MCVQISTQSYDLQIYSCRLADVFIQSAGLVSHLYNFCTKDAAVGKSTSWVERTKPCVHVWLRKKGDHDIPQETSHLPNHSHLVCLNSVQVLHLLSFTKPAALISEHTVVPWRTANISFHKKTLPVNLTLFFNLDLVSYWCVQCYVTHTDWTAGKVNKWRIDTTKTARERIQ